MPTDAECARGHVLDEENAYYPPNCSSVVCRKCMAFHAAQYRERHRDKVLKRERERKQRDRDRQRSAA